MQPESAPLPAGKTCIQCRDYFHCARNNGVKGHETHCFYTPSDFRGLEEELWEREERMDPAPDEHGNTCYDCANFFVCRSKGGSLTPCENPALGFQKDKPSPYTLLRFRV